MKKWLLKILPFIVGLLPGVNLEGNEKLELSEEDKSKLDKETGTEGFAEKFEKAFNKFMVKDENLQAAFDGFMQEYEEAMAEAGIDDPPTEDGEEAPEAQEVPKGEEASDTGMMNKLIKAANNLLASNKEKDGLIEAMQNQSETDSPETIPPGTKNQAKVKHSKTHLFASGHSYDALDRPWNKRVIDSINKGRAISGNTVWNKVNIDKLNEDLGAYSRRNSSEIVSLIMDGYDIPAHWGRVNNVQDEFIFSAIITGQITQGFKKRWLPKNKQRFVPIKNKIFDKQIDITWEPSELKSIEKSWLNMFFNEGSTPYKMSFAGYLLTELMKKAREEDKLNIHKGVYFDTELLPEDVAGDFMNAMDGYLKLVSDYRGVAFQPHNLPELTPINTYRTLKEWVEGLPIGFRNLPNLKLQLGSDVHRWYYEGRESEKGVIQDYEKNTTTVEGFSNVEFVPIKQWEGTGYVDIQVGGNCGIMVDRDGEEAQATIEMVKREISAFTDYKNGVYFKVFGANVDPSLPVGYEDQMFFCNSVQLLDDTYTPVIANDTTPSVADHHALIIGANNTAATDITQLDDVVEGTVYHIRGNSDATPSTLKNNTNILLDGGDFVLGNGDEIVLIGLSGNRVIEFSRTEAGSVAEPTKVALAADATTADAANGTHFVTAANTGPTAFTNITNAIAGEEYTLEGGSGTNATTVANGGNFLLSAAFTASVGAFLKVKYNGSKFIEVSRG
ncbi:hypothetical protein L0P88_04030 [Muricauda sp. SCSIO 64092]|uniref:hypothetical protein n=1 Tax=Allomuricauda sp. SCSIO 64092 TaxID=2908842 RepID=UPI001FF1AAAE|nr:hypothetical protein [Muricauda sp. SCSIO 64092]UOY07723.1 hypothetical protein L0P88_04030 [Muricauda sp. SCSIO 64092]